MSTDIHFVRYFRIFVVALSAFALVTQTVFASPLGWLLGESVVGSGSIKLQHRDADHFTAINIELPATVELRQGKDEGITIETDDNVLPLIETVVEGLVLKIRPLKKNTHFDTKTLKVIIEARKINNLSVADSASVYAANLHAPSLRIAIGGSSAVNIKSLDSDTLAATLGGSGTLKAKGTAGSVSIAIGGSAGVEAGQLNARDVSISLAGSGRAVVWAREELSLSMAGSGNVKYYGDPKVHQSVAGSASVTRLGSAPQ